MLNTMTANRLLVTVTQNSYKGLGGPPAAGFNVNVEGMGAVLCGIPKELAQRAAYRLAHTPYVRIELDAIRAELA